MIITAVVAAVVLVWGAVTAAMLIKTTTLPPLPEIVDPLTATSSNSERHRKVSSTASWL